MARGNYLRMRGEYPEQDSIPAHWWELPPHARRIHDAYTQAEVAERTTSACAENTVDGAHLLAFDWNYLRMRGEYVFRTDLFAALLELPPHARRIRYAEAGCEFKRGTTSACAENTHQTKTLLSTQRNYLRMRGEYIKEAAQGLSEPELPPHARRIPPP